MRAPVVCHIRFIVEREFCQWAFGGWRRPDALLWTTHQQRQDCAAAIEGVVDEHHQHLIPLGPDPEAFSENGVDRAALRRNLDIREGELVIGTATALRPVKRIEDFIELTRVLAAEWARDQITVNALAPGYFLSPMNEARFGVSSTDAPRKSLLSPTLAYTILILKS